VTENSGQDRATDPRSQRSRDALIGATLALLQEREGTEITASDVVRAAQVSRPTLYQHFGDLPTLLATAVGHRIRVLFADVLGEGEAGPEAARDGVAQLLTRLHAEAALFRHAVNGPSGYAALRELAAALAERLRHHAPWRATLDAPDAPAGLAEFLSHGTVGIVAGWLETCSAEADAVPRLTDQIMTLLTLHLNPENA